MKRILSLILAVAMMLSVMVVPVAFAAETAQAADIIIEVGSQYVTEEGKWDKGSSLKGPSGNPSWYTRAAVDSTVKFSTSHVAPGEYEVSYWKIVHTDGRNDKTLAAEITHAGGVTETVINHDEGSTGWESLGKFTFNEGDEDGVKIARIGKNDTICSRVAAIKLTPIKIFTEADASAAASGLSEDDQYITELLTYIGVCPIIDLSQPEAQVTRAQFLAAILKTLNAPVVAEAEDFLDVPATHTYYKEIMSARANGIVVGDGNNYFKPDNAISFEEAAKIAIHSLELLSTTENIAVERANAQGGYTVGYVLELNKQGLAKGLPANVSAAPLTTESTKTIVMNILNAKVREIVTEDKVNVLQRVHDIYEGYGKLNTVFGATVDASKAVDKGFAYVDDKKFALEDLVVDKYLGQDVDYYYVDKAINDQIIAMRTQPSVEVIEIAAEDILSAAYSTGTSTENIEIDYYDENGKVDRVAIHQETVVFFNNVKITNDTPADYRNFQGTLKLVGNSSKTKFDYAYITSYENFVVKRVNTIDEKVYDINNTEFNLKVDFPEGYEFYRNGKAVKLEKLAEYDVLSKPARREGTAVPEVANIEFARKKVEGVLESRNSKEFYVDGKAYELDADYKNVVESTASEAAKFSLGKSIVLYLDVNGKVAYADEGKGVSGKVAWLNKAAETKGLSAGHQLEALLADGTWGVLKLADDISYQVGNGAIEKISAEEFISRVEKPFDFDAELEKRFLEHKESLNLKEYWFYPCHNASPGYPFHSTLTAVGGWKGSNSTVLVYPGDTTGNDANSCYTDNAGLTATHTFAGIEAGDYKVIYYHVTHNASDTGNYTIDVTSADGTVAAFDTTTDLTLAAGTPHPQELGVYSFTGAAGEGVTLSTAGGRVRLGAFKLETPFDEDAARERIANEITAELDSMPTSIEKVVEYSLNSAGEVKEIKLLAAGTATAPATAGTGHKPFFTSVGGFVDGNKLLCTVDSSSVIFLLPEDKEDKEEYSVGNGSMFKQGERFYFTAYDESDDGYAPILVAEVGGESDEDAAPDLLIVQSLSRVYDEAEEEVVSALRVISGTKEVVFKEAVEGVFNGLKFGDIIKIKSKDTKGRVKTIENVYTYTDGPVVGKDTGSTSKGTHVAVGTVEDINSSKLFLNIGSVTNMYSSAGAKVYLIDAEEQTITPATIGSISIGDALVYTSYKFVPSSIFIYK